MIFNWISVGCSDNPEQWSTQKTKSFPSQKEIIIPAPELKKDELRQAGRIDSFIQSLVKLKVFNGNILIAKKGKIIYQKQYGIADSKSKKALKVNSVYQLASVSKTLTSTLILLLAQEGKIDIKKKVAEYLPGFPYTDVSVENLLTHRSGLPNYINFTEKYVKPDSAGFTNKDIFDVMKKHVPAIYAKPDKVFDYSNTNYFLLSMIAEKVSGKDFEKLMREKIFVPLKMKNTYFFSETSKIPDSIRTAGHDEKMRKLLPEQFDKVKGDKGIFSTTNDLFLFMEAYYNHKLLNKDLLLAATTPKSREKKKSNYGYGWRMKEYETPEKVVFHNGWWRGYRTALHRIYKDSTTVVVLTNNLLNTAYRVKDFVDVMNGIKPNSKDSEHPNEH